VRVSTPMPEIFHEMSSKRLGMTCVIDDGGRLAGVFTDGDLRRLLTKTTDVLRLTAGQVMTPDPITIDRRLLAVEALKLMEGRKVTSVVVVDEDRRVEGVVHLHDLWRTQMV
jgi:arabinose-5-phosphate isomerase